MRIALVAATTAFGLLVDCGGPQTSQANNVQANISNEAHGPPTANASTTGNAMVMLAVAPSNDQLLAIMHERHEGMETIGKTNKAIYRELGGGSPDLGTVRSGAAKIADLSRKASGWFPKGSGPELGKTGAKPEIWQSPQDFAAKLHDFQMAASSFTAAASGNDLNATKAKFAAMGQACKACHDKYRSEMHH